jgi:hypothetical protein
MSIFDTWNVSGSVIGLSKFKPQIFRYPLDLKPLKPTISLEMPVPSQGHYGFHSFPVVDWFCLFI